MDVATPCITPGSSPHAEPVTVAKTTDRYLSRVAVFRRRTTSQCARHLRRRALTLATAATRSSPPAHRARRSRRAASGPTTRCGARRTCTRSPRSRLGPPRPRGAAIAPTAQGPAVGIGGGQRSRRWSDSKRSAALHLRDVSTSLLWSLLLDSGSYVRVVEAQLIFKSIKNKNFKEEE